MAIEKLNAESFAGKGVVGLPDTPGLSALEMQEKFEEISKMVIAPKVNELIDALAEHQEETGNPHSVTKEEVGLGNVDNTSDLEKPVSEAQAGMMASLFQEVNDRVLMHMTQRENPHEVTAAQIGLGNVNLLHNGDFRNPVNQRSGGSYSGAKTFGIDRWQMDPDETAATGTLSVMSGFVTWKGNKLRQTVEFLPAGVYTASVECLANERKNISMQMILGDTVLEGDVITLTRQKEIYSCTFELAEDSWNVAFQILNENRTAGVRLYRMKLESGAQSSLASEAPVDLGLETMKCRRYFQKLSGGTEVQVSSPGNGAEVYLPFSPPMRSDEVQVQYTVLSGTPVHACTKEGLRLSGGAFSVSQIEVSAEI